MGEPRCCSLQPRSLSLPNHSYYRSRTIFVWGSQLTNKNKGWSRIALILGVALLVNRCHTASAQPTKLAIEEKKNLIYREVDGEQLAADIYRPKNSRGYPLVLLIHGGAWTAGDKWNLVLHARQIAQAGFVAVAINYRLAPKFKMRVQIDD